MHISVGTFNVNNLLSRYNFNLQASVENLPEGNVCYIKTKSIVTSLASKPVEYKSKSLHPKDPAWVELEL